MANTDVQSIIYDIRGIRITHMGLEMGCAHKHVDVHVYTNTVYVGVNTCQ